MREIWDAVQAGDLERAREIDAGLHPLYEALAVTTNPMPLKAALEMTGIIPSASCRLPLVELDEEQRGVVGAALESVGLAVTSGSSGRGGRRSCGSCPSAAWARSART